MRVAATFLCLLLIPATAYNAAGPAAATPMLHYVKQSDFAGVRFVKQSDFAKPKLSVPVPEIAVDPFAERYRQAVATNQPLYVWVGYRCPSSADQLAGALHVHLPIGWRGIAKPSVVVLRPSSPPDGWLRRMAVVDAKDCCAAELARALAGPAEVRAARVGGA